MLTDLLDDEAQLRSNVPAHLASMQLDLNRRFLKELEGAHRAVLVSEVDRRERSSAQSCRSSREYRTLRPNLRKAGPPPETRSFARVECPKPRYSAASLGLNMRYCIVFSMIRPTRRFLA